MLAEKAAFAPSAHFRERPHGRNRAAGSCRHHICFDGTRFAYSILADKNFLTVVQTALGISPYTSQEDIDTQAKLLSGNINFSDFQDPAKLQKFIEKFCALYDENNASATSSQNSSVPNALLSSGSSTIGFSDSLMNSMQGVKIGI